MIRSGNPALNENAFKGLPMTSASDAMTLQGTVNKTAILVLLCFASAAYTWNATMTAVQMNQAPSMGYLWAGLIGGLILAMITIFKKNLAPITAPLYALVEGLVLGVLSAIFETQYTGIVVQAVFLTFGVLFFMLFLYKSRIIKVTDKLRMGVVAATGGIALVYLISIILGFFGIQIPLIHQSGPIGILFSLVVVGIASFNLLLDFDFIENASNSARSPKYMEWYGAFGLIVTLIWLYMELLRLLSKIRGGRH